MALLQKFISPKTKTLGHTAPEPSHDVGCPTRITAVVVRWTCQCTEIWTRSAETVAAVCSVCGGQFEPAHTRTAAHNGGQ
jgi:hypothetical protein